MSDLEIRKKENGLWKFVTGRSFSSPMNTHYADVDLHDPHNRTPNPNSPALTSIIHFAPHQIHVQLRGRDLSLGNVDAITRSGTEVCLRPIRQRVSGRETADSAEIIIKSTGEIFKASHTAEPVKGIRRTKQKPYTVLHKMRGR